jgi:Fe-S-cluster formation regulator IscX/YfhJ
MRIYTEECLSGLAKAHVFDEFLYMYQPIPDEKITPEYLHDLFADEEKGYIERNSQPDPETMKFYDHGIEETAKGIIPEEYGFAVRIDGNGKEIPERYTDPKALHDLLVQNRAQYLEEFEEEKKSPEEMKKAFEEAGDYQLGDFYDQTYGKGAFDGVDPLLLRFHQLPQSVYDRVRKRLEEEKASSEKILEENQRKWGPYAITDPEKLRLLDQHDSCLSAFHQDGEDLILDFDQSGSLGSGPASLRFIQAEVTEKEGFYPGAWITESEAFRIDGRTEADFLVNQKECLTITCEDFREEKKG